MALGLNDFQDIRVRLYTFPMFPKLYVFSLLFGVVAGACGAESSADVPPHRFEIGSEQFLLDGKPFLIRCGEIHFARIPHEYWRHRLQMCRAMGLNAVCVYLFWNYHEWNEGTFDWKEQADAAEFCRLAQQEGLWVILRPGPYSCAEWEMGGTPWWLLKRKGIALRTCDPAYLVPAKRFLQEVGRVLAPLQITRGGPLLMVQVENEYGSFGKDAAYMGELKDAMRAAGFTVPLFACNPPNALANGFRDDLFQVVNFGGGAEYCFKELRKFQKTGPLMNGEFYPGWFDCWGRPHHTGVQENIMRELRYMLENGMSFSIYMAHGGTSFGLWAGADRPFKPDTSSYDYDAPISEAGCTTERFFALRELFSKHLEPGEALPAVPAAMPVVSVPAFSLTEVSPILEHRLPSVVGEFPLSVEDLGHARGCTLYSTTIDAGQKKTLSVDAANDFAWVFLDGTFVGAMDRRSRHFSVELPARTSVGKLDILVESMGRINFGLEMLDSKGLHGPVLLGDGENRIELNGWRMSPMPLDEKELKALSWQPAATAVGKVNLPAFWRGTFSVSQLGDNFLDLRTWGKGVVWVNGKCLGRYWNIGPTQTMFCPAPWLHLGDNEIIILDLLGPEAPVIAGLTAPILDETHPEKDFGPTRRAAGVPVLDPIKAVHAGHFEKSVGWNRADFDSVKKGRYLCLEVTSCLDNGNTTGIAELDLLGRDGVVIPKDRWRILWVSSEGMQSADGVAENILDGQSNTAWMTEWAPEKCFPKRIVIDLGRTEDVTGMRQLPAANGAGAVGSFRVYFDEEPFGLKAVSI